MRKKVKKPKVATPQRIPDEIPDEAAPAIEQTLMSYRYAQVRALPKKRQQKADRVKAVLVELDALTIDGRCEGGLEEFCKKHTISRKALYSWRKRRHSDILLSGGHVDVRLIDEKAGPHRKKKLLPYLDARFVWEALKIMATRPDINMTDFAKVLGRNLSEIGHHAPGFHTLYKVVRMFKRLPAFVRCVSGKEFRDLFEVRLRYDRSHEKGLCSMDEATTAFMLDGDTGSQNLVRFAVAIDHATRFAWLKWKKGAFDAGDVLILGREVFLPGEGVFSDIAYSPHTIRSDAAGVFACAQTKDACAELGVQKTEIISHKSHLNGLAERLIGGIKARLKKYQVVVREEKRGKLNVIYLRYTFEELERVFNEVLRDYLMNDVHSSIKATPFAKYMEVYGKQSTSAERVRQVISAFRLRMTPVVKNKGIQAVGRYWWFPGMEAYLEQTVEVRISPEGENAEAYSLDGKKKLGTLELLPGDPATRRWIRENLNRDRINAINQFVAKARRAGIDELPGWHSEAAKRGIKSEMESTPSREGYVSRKKPQQVGKATHKRLRKMVEAGMPDVPVLPPAVGYTPFSCQSSVIVEDSW